MLSNMQIERQQGSSNPEALRLNAAAHSCHVKTREPLDNVYLQNCVQITFQTGRKNLNHQLCKVVHISAKADHTMHYLLLLDNHLDHQQNLINCWFSESFI